MYYDTKVIINGIEIGQSEAVGVPSIASLKVINSASNGDIEIGSTASDSLIFTINNPYKVSFDGDKVELFIRGTDSTEQSTKERIEDEVGADATDEGIDEDDLIAEDEDEEEGEALTPEDELDIQEYSEEMIALQTAIYEGEATEALAYEEETEEEWTPLGVYYVRSQTNADNSVTLTCYDAFSLLNASYELNGARTWAEHFANLQAQMLEAGVVLEVFETENDDDAIAFPTGRNLREALSELVGYIGGYATCTDEGHIAVSFYSYADMILIDSDLISLQETSASEVVIDGAECYGSNGSLIQSEGTGQNVSFTNSLVTEEILNDVIAPIYRGQRIQGGVLQASWNTELRAGEFIRVMTEDEYRNYLELGNSAEDTRADRNALGKVFLISTQEITFGADATTVIRSLRTSESDREKYVFPPTLKKIIEASKTATNYMNVAEDGALVISRDIDNYSIRLDADSLDIMQGDDLRASFGEICALRNGNTATNITPTGMDVYANDRKLFGVNTEQAPTVEWFDTWTSTKDSSKIAFDSSNFATFSGQILLGCGFRYDNPTIVDVSTQFIAFRDGDTIEVMPKIPATYNGLPVWGIGIGCYTKDGELGGINVDINGDANISGRLYAQGKAYFHTKPAIFYAVGNIGENYDLNNWIVEEKAIGQWTVRKYANGKMEARKSMSWSASTYTAWGQVYYRNVTTTLPVGFTSVENAFVTSTHNQSWAVVGSLDVNEIGLRFFSATAASKQSAADIIVYGTWR